MYTCVYIFVYVYMAASKLGVHFLGLFRIRALLVRVCISISQVSEATQLKICSFKDPLDHQDSRQDWKRRHGFERRRRRTGRLPLFNKAIWGSSDIADESPILKPEPLALRPRYPFQIPMAPYSSPVLGRISSVLPPLTL